MSSEKIDESLYSRQLYVIGVEAMKKLISSSVMISGIGGLGVEIAKNIILAGVKNVILHDTRSAKIDDLASQFYLNEKDIGRNRAEASKSKLASLNDYVTVSVNTDELSESVIKSVHCLVLTDYHSYSEVIKISNICHSNDIKFILGDVRGVFGLTFVDFGSNFQVVDSKGKQPARFLLSSISIDGLVTINEEESPGLSDNDLVRFEDVEGMYGINGKEFPIKIMNAYQFEIGDVSSYGAYTSTHSCGYGNQIFAPLNLSFKSFEESIKEPKVVIFDFRADGRDQQVILAFLAFMKYLDEYSEIPSSVSYDEILHIAQEINSTFQIVEKIEESILQPFSQQTKAVISPMAATYGGIIGQEVLKAVSNKFTPIFQFLAVGAIESLPTKINFSLKNDRYDAYRIIFGNEQVDAMHKLRYFVIGAGALGCEFLKNFAMIGVATEGEGKIFVTDMDQIEKSNLSRQFLFRNKDIGALKSVSAANAVKEMNDKINIEVQSNRVGPESSGIYNDNFYQSLSGVCNALDNVETRRYSDQMCIFYKKPMLESGTLGPEAYFQMIIPYLTESYSSTSSPPEKSIPQCTLHHFPENINHCCMWAREQFCNFFERDPNTLNRYLSDPNMIEELSNTNPDELVQSLQILKSLLKDHPVHNYEDCVYWTRQQFEDLFNYKIRDLLHSYPEDHVSENGVPFWKGHKHAPTPLEYDPNNEYHAEFILQCSTIIARIYDIQATGNPIQMAAQINFPNWCPPNIQAQIDINNQNPQHEIITIETALNLNQELIRFKNRSLVKPEEFEKDSETNGHIAFITAASNLRALNYKIKPETQLEIKRIAGKIIPAISTTTAMICGLVTIEMFKVHSLQSKPIEATVLASLT